jgi:chemotaxis protein histidine kinase CheA
VKIPDDPFIIELLPEFVDTWIEDINKLLPEILKTQNTEELYRFGHTLKGSCYQFGLDEVAELGIKIMSYSKESNWTEANASEQILKQKFADVKLFVESHLNK